jgi:hypothetical protein
VLASPRSALNAVRGDPFSLAAQRLFSDPATNEHGRTLVACAPRRSQAPRRRERCSSVITTQGSFSGEWSMTLIRMVVEVYGGVVQNMHVAYEASERRVEAVIVG